MNCGIAGMDTSGQRELAQLGVVTEGRGEPGRVLAKFAGAGIDRKTKVEAMCGASGVNTRHNQAAAFGAAGLNYREAIDVASTGISGNLAPVYRARLPEMVQEGGGKQTLGDRAAAVAHRHAVLMADWTYVVCTNHPHDESLRWRKGRQRVFGKEHRRLPLYLDSGAYRIWTGTAPRWANFDNYLTAIELVDADGYFALDIIGNQAESLRNYDAMRGMGLEPIPVYHVRPRWSDRASVDVRVLPQKARTAIANAHLAAQDPVLQYYASKSQLVGLGGMVRGPIPRDVRHYYIAELCRLFPDHHFWALGQANFKVINGLGPLGLLERVWTDGTWWLLDAACERMAIVQEGQIRMLSLEGVAQSFFTMAERMAANLRSLLAAYAGLWAWPPPDPIPADLSDREQVVELSERVTQARLELFGEGPVTVYGSVPVRRD